MALTVLFFLATLFYYSGGDEPPLSEATTESTLNGWTHFKDQTFIKIATNAGLQSQRDAEIICQSYSSVVVTLITIKTKEEQTFLERFLFVDNHIKDNVWLGLKEVEQSGEFEWTDGSKPYYSNWANQTVSGDEHHCVQMESGGASTPSGLWVKVRCDETAVVVCERTETLTLDALQTLFFNYKLEQKQQNEKAEKELASLKQQNSEAEKAIDNMTQTIQEFQRTNGVPAGFIYAQMPGQAPPTSLWPGTNWTDVSAKYAGLFFRVDGGKAAPFGEVQEANWTGMEVHYKDGRDQINPITIPHDGSWSKNIASGGWCLQCIHWQFRLLDGEVRPRNQAMRLWQKM